MKIGALVFLTDQSGNPGAIAREAEDLGFESFFVAEHMVVPSTYTTHYPRSRDGKVPEYYARLIDPPRLMGSSLDCIFTVQKPYVIELSGLTSSEKQIPRNCWKH